MRDDFKDVSAEAKKRGHETTDIRLRPILWCAVAVVVMAGLAQAVLLLIHTRLHDRAAKSDAADREQFVVHATARPGFPEPRLQIDPREDFEKLRAREEAELNSYGWVDRKHGVVRIPIERAMALMVEKENSKRKTGTQKGKSSLELMQERPAERSKEKP